MTTTMTQQGIPAVEFPIKRPPPQYPVVGKWDAGRIIPHEARYEPWMIGDIVIVDDIVWRVVDFGRRRGGIDITAEYHATMYGAAELAEIEGSLRGDSIYGQV